MIYDIKSELYFTFLSDNCWKYFGNDAKYGSSVHFYDNPYVD